MGNIILFDKNYKSLLEDIIGKSVIIYWPEKKNLDYFTLIKSMFLKTIKWKVELKILYYYLEIKKFSPEILISFQDTNLNIIKLSKLFKKVKFILVQDSFRPPGFYGKLKMKKNDLFLTYTPLVKFNLSNQEFTFKTFKYHKQKSEREINDGLIFISQYRNYSSSLLRKVIKDYYHNTNFSIRKEIDFISHEKFLLKNLDEYSKKHNIKLNYKSAFHKNSRFNKDDEKSYFQAFNIEEIKISAIDALNSKNFKIIFIAIDSTMIFELLSFGQKVLIYPYRDIYIDQEMDPHIKILQNQFPDLFLEKNFSDFPNKFLKLKNMSKDDYNRYVIKFKNLPLFSVEDFL